MTLPRDRPDNSAYCCARFLASAKASARASLTSVESFSMEKVTELMRVASPPASMIAASRSGAASRSRILTPIVFPARYPVTTEFSPYCGCRLTPVVLMSLASVPSAVRASITVRWRSLDWFIAVVASGATTSMPTSAVRVSGAPRTSPEPTTVT